MSYPHDAGLDADTLALLAGFRSGAPAAAPDAEMLGHLRDDMPADLKAWLHTYALHGGLVSIGDAWFEAGNVQPLRHVVEAFEPDDDSLAHEGVDGLDLDAAMVMGNTADGEVFFAAAWRPGDERLTLVKFCCAGYADDGYHALGSLVAGLRRIADKVEDPSEIDEAVRAVLAPGR
ncbi:MAG: hypothetical protein HS111_22615 [Kofleriaceae bacterium]|nr:hypothetical protein [Kofleriaceae bacterium]MCL4224837.1 hypothetical protein [Myxococcales bacterium]